MLLDQLFISKDYRGKGIGRNSLGLCASQAAEYGAINYMYVQVLHRITIAFYNKCGCIMVKEINDKLMMKIK